MALATDGSVSSLATLGVTAKDVPAVRRRIADLESKLSDVRPAVGSATDRARLARKQKQLRAALVELAAADAALALVNEDHAQAVDSARVCLKHSVELYGEGAVQLVPAYSLLASAHLGIGKAHEAEELLATANWAVVRAGEDAPPAERSRVARGFGRLNAARGDLERAAQSFAEAAYEVALATGPESVDAAHIYFELGVVFDRMAGDGDADGPAASPGASASPATAKALACFDKAVSCWYRALQHARGDAAGRPNSQIAPWAVMAEGSAVVSSVAQACAARLGPRHTAVHEAHFTLGLLEWARGNLAQAAELCAAAAEGFREASGEDCDAALDAAAALAAVQEEARMQA